MVAQTIVVRGVQIVSQVLCVIGFSRILERKHIARVLQLSRKNCQQIPGHCSSKGNVLSTHLVVEKKQFYILHPVCAHQVCIS